MKQIKKWKRIDEELVGHLYVFFENYLFRSFTHFLVRWLVVVVVVFVLLLSCRSSLYVFVIRHMVCRYLLPFHRLPFTLLIVSFPIQKLFSLRQSHLSIFAFVACAFDVMTNVKKLFSRFCSSGFTFLGLTFKSLIHLEFTMYMVWDKGPISFFCMLIPSFSNTTYWRNFPFPIMCSWHPGRRSVGYKWPTGLWKGAQYY